MNAIIEFINAISSGEKISASAVLVFVLAFVIYKVIGKHVEEAYSKIRKKKSHEKEVSSLKADLISALQRIKEVEKMLVKFIDLTNRQKELIMHLKAEIRKYETADSSNESDV